MVVCLRVFGLAALEAMGDLPLRASAGLGPDFPHNHTYQVVAHSVTEVATRVNRSAGCQPATAGR
jgi:hypothetical protein